MNTGSLTVELVKLTLCGPTDVAKEISIASEIINDWNCRHGEQRGFWIKHQHWSTDSYPDAQETGQGAINKQLIDSTDILVAIFWSRIGTATASAESGTVEEIQRAIKQGKNAMVYFSDLEPLPAGTSSDQLNRLEAFRQELRAERSCCTFQSRRRFREDFTTHLALMLNDFPLGRKRRSHRKLADTAASGGAPRRLPSRLDTQRGLHQGYRSRRFRHTLGRRNGFRRGRARAGVDRAFRHEFGPNEYLAGA